MSAGVLASLLERLQADGGRYLLSIALTADEFRAQTPPTYGGKSHSRWLTVEEYQALCALTSDLERMRGALRDLHARHSRTLKEAGGCDHSVGICWCEDIRALDDAAALLPAQTGGKQT